MARNTIIQDILGQPWLIDARAADQYLPQIHSMIKGEGFYDDGTLFFPQNFC